MERVCANCLFWCPTAKNDDFGGSPVTGRCEPAKTDSDWRPDVMCWPAAAVSWDGDECGCCGALLLTAATFGCTAFQAGGPAGGQ
jgi:hypothetical protein